MTKTIYLNLILLCFAYTSYGAEQHECATNQVCLPITALKAAAFALKQFQKDQPHADMEKFTVVVEEFSALFEIKFVPNPVPTKEGSNGNLNYIEIPSGGGNKYGRDVLYQVSKSDGKILKTLFSK
jgi:hypothetical protein